ncbi:MAG: penicillin acylase family protein, partial [Actinobacteria bacterium]|nr:penicillin acylase family protein [Actinomycetota bacterium]
MTGNVDVRWTTGGVAHIRADDYYGLGFGQGFACARDNLGTIWDAAVKVRSERARFFGLGPESNFVASDLGYLALDVSGRAEALRRAQSSTVADLVAGYTAGANAWLDEALATGVVPAWCDGAEWLVPLTEHDLYRTFVDSALMASGRNLVGLIGRAEAPGPEGPCAPSPLSALGSANAASNGWAFGRDATACGGGLVVANPHFPWYGEARFWECHLTIPGEIDVYGASLIGLPGVHLGFNASIGWTHTFSRGHRFTLYRLDLAPGDPTRYRFGDEERAMEPATFETLVRTSNGELEPVRRTLWSSHHGPMVNLPLLGWGTDVGFAYRDANIGNTGMLELFLGLDRARDLDDIEEVLASTRAMPWLNTIAADSSGDVLYIDASATPNLSEAAQRRFRERLATDPVAALLADNRVALLDGSDPDDSWVEEPGAREPGLVPHGRLPRLRRSDLVLNCNDSHWLSHPEAVLEGYSVLHGFERTPRSLRTRQNLLQTGALADAGSVTAEDALTVIVQGATLTARLLRDDVVERLGHHEELRAVAEILAQWDGTVGVDARGAVLWREFLAGFAPGDFVDAGALFGRPFDVAEPIRTPDGLARAPEGGEDPVVVAMRAALEVLAAAGVEADARLGDVQWARCGAERIGVPGGCEVEGVANVLGAVGALASQSLVPVPDAPDMLPPRAGRTGLATGGYQVGYGTSLLFAVELGPDGPRGLGLLAYGQSEDHTAPGAAESARALA